MRVAGRISSCMPKVHNVTVAVPPAHELHTAPAYGNHRRSRRNRVVDGLMGSHATKDRMLSFRGKRRRNSRVTQRRAQKRAPYRLPIPIIVRSVAVFRYVIKRAEVFLVYFQLSRENSSEAAATVRVASLFDN